MKFLLKFSTLTALSAFKDNDMGGAANNSTGLVAIESGTGTSTTTSTSSPSSSAITTQFTMEEFNAIDNDIDDDIFKETTAEFLERHMTTIFDGMFRVTDYVADKMSEAQTTICDNYIIPNIDDHHSTMATIIYDKVHLCSRLKTTFEVWTEYVTNVASFAVDIATELVDNATLYTVMAYHLTVHGYRTMAPIATSYVQSTITNITTSYTACISIITNGILFTWESIILKTMAEVKDIGHTIVVRVINNKTTLVMIGLVTMIIVAIVAKLSHDAQERINEAIRSNAAKTIQDAWRSHLAVKAKHNKAASTIQRAYKAYLVKKQNKAAAIIQRAYRRHHARIVEKQNKAATVIQRAYRARLAEKAKLNKAATKIQSMARLFLQTMKCASESQKDEIRFKYFQRVKMAQAEVIRQTVQIATVDDHAEGEDDNVIDESITENKFEEACRVLGLAIYITRRDIVDPDHDDDIIKTCYRQLLKKDKKDPEKRVILKEAEQVLLEYSRSHAKKQMYEQYWAYERTHSTDPTVLFETQESPTWLARHTLGVERNQVYNQEVVEAAYLVQLEKIATLQESKSDDENYQFCVEYSLDLFKLAYDELFPQSA